MSKHTWHEGDEDAPAPETPERYGALEELGRGGMGVVDRVRDAQLGRVVARKAVRADFAGHPNVHARFVAEAETTAQLQHPGIVPVYDMGLLPDGRPFFTMPEVHGRTLTAAIREAHGDGGATALRRLVAHFASVCDTIAYAHSRGVVHRDLKPDNVMLGPFGEVLVLDWGLSRRAQGADLPEDAVQTSLDSSGTRLTRVGAISGTPAYLAPEQARGDTTEAPADVWALGALLYEILADRPPWVGSSARATLERALAGPPDAIAPAGLPVPDELRALAAQALAYAAAERPSAGQVGVIARRWLDGADREERGRAMVLEAAEEARTADALRTQAVALAVEAEARLAEIPVHADVEAKRTAWQLEDEATRCLHEAALRDVEHLRKLGAALSLAPELREAHAALAAVYRAAHEAAEDRGDAVETARAEVLLRAHDRGEHWAWLAGTGSVSLVTDPPAKADLYRYERVDRRLVPRFVRSLGTTPLAAVELPHGRWLIELTAPGRRRVRYPFFLRRGEHWDGVPPEGGEPVPVWLPGEADLDPHEVYVPAGWSWFGGDDRAENGGPSERLWVDAFAIGRHPVTNREYIAFLDDLVASGREEEALRQAPRDREPLYGRNAEGGFVCVPDIDGDVWGLDWPVMMIDWSQARAYAEWYAARTGRPWRLPAEFELEKASRGPDRRVYPWGDATDPSWANIILSRGENPLPEPVGARPVDQGPYGSADHGGGVREWCLDHYQHRLPSKDGRPLLIIGELDPMMARSARGGCWVGRPDASRCAARNWLLAISRITYIGMRVARSIGPARVGGIAPGTAP